MSATHQDLLSAGKKLRRDLVEFGEREGVSIIEMVSFLGAMVLDLGIRLETIAGIEAREKSYDVPLAGDLAKIIASFGERNQISPIEMLVVLGSMVIDLAASIESAVNTGARLN